MEMPVEHSRRKVTYAAVAVVCVLAIGAVMTVVGTSDPAPHCDSNTTHPSSGDGQMGRMITVGMVCALATACVVGEYCTRTETSNDDPPSVFE